MCAGSGFSTDPQASVGLPWVTADPITTTAGLLCAWPRHSPTLRSLGNCETPQEGPGLPRLQAHVTPRAVLHADPWVPTAAEPPFWEALPLPWRPGCPASPVSTLKPSGHPYSCIFGTYSPTLPGLSCPCLPGTSRRASPSRTRPDGSPRAGHVWQNPCPCLEASFWARAPEVKGTEARGSSPCVSCAGVLLCLGATGGAWSQGCLSPLPRGSGPSPPLRRALC